VSAQPPFLAELFSLDGRIAVVTGGSSGIGAGMAAALARAGARVVLVARDAVRRRHLVRMRFPSFMGCARLATRMWSIRLANGSCMIW